MVLEGYLKGSGATDEQRAAPGRLTAREREIVPALEALLDSPDLELVGFEAEPPGIVATATAFGGTRIVDMLVGEQLPRIC